MRIDILYNVCSRCPTETESRLTRLDSVGLLLSKGTTLHGRRNRDTTSIGKGDDNHDRGMDF